ncbi:MAG: TlyA family RNA methyltransferase [Bryobacteraceae bacterium]|jgi:23S rRNA (cytidine1920-2'-O)/16S rRNA (cytidine1409-2'-O)-methyltransferase
MKARLDRLLVERGLAPTREKAQALIMAGEVLVDGRKAEKSGQPVDAEGRIEILAQPPFVGRGGLKLDAAIAHFGIRVAGRICLDIGASTGGFTDCLLQRGAARVHAVDVGTGQLDWKIRSDPRVVVHEKLNARYLRPEDLGVPIDLAVCDVSFISATLILPAVNPVLQPDGEMVILVKPQFEAGKGQVGKGGIVREPELHQAACRRVDDAARQLGFETSIIESPILGAEGNKEFLLYAHR